VLYSDISDVIFEKIRLIELYGSQNSKAFLSSNSVKALAEYRAIQTRFDPKLTHVEAFEVLKMMTNTDYALLPTKRLAEDLKPSRNIIEFIS
jgi:hypothetical protein